jgi:hypothetical protein
MSQLPPPLQPRYAATWERDRFEPFDPAQLTAFHLVRNVLITGSVGTGKTVLAKVLLQRAAQLGDVMVLDVKGEYGDCVAWARGRGRAATILAIGREPRLRLNPLEPPPGVMPSVWIGTVADIITRCYGLGEPSRRILQDCILNLYREHGLEAMPTAPVTWPTLRELEQTVAAFPAVGSREVNSRRSLESRLHLMAAGELGKSLNTMVGYDPSYFNSRIVVAELDWLSNLRDQRVLGELLVSALWEFRKANAAARQRLLVVFLEEAHRFVPEARGPWERGSRTLLEQCFAEARSYGFGVVAVDQQPSLLSRYVLANTGSKFAGRLSSEEDVQLMIDALLLHEVLGPEVLLRKLLPGQMYGQLLYAAGDEATWGRGHHCYTLPLPASSSSAVVFESSASLAWILQKLQCALLDTFIIRNRRLSHCPVNSGFTQELERFLQRQLRL